MAFEIERKFLLKGFPRIKPDVELDVETAYITTGDTEVRIRSMEVLTGDWIGKIDYLMTFKGKGDLVRQEVNNYISEKTYHELLNTFHLPTFYRHYRVYNIDGHKIEACFCDNWLGETMYLAEVEFDSEEEAKAYVFPFDGAVDVTNNPYYKMANFWRRSFCNENHQ